MRLFGLIGYPLSHSFSANYFEKKFADELIRDATYKLFPLEHISELHDLLTQNPDLKGFNITIPHKVSILPELHCISDEASAIGAVNCVKVTRDLAGINLYGYNTDVYGFRESLLQMLEFNHQKALVLGTGGASKAVCYVLDKLNIGYTLVSRKKKEHNHLTYSQVTKKDIRNNLLIINTTPCGMYPDVDNCPALPYQYLTDKHLLYDLVYNPDESLFLKRGKAVGSKTKNGEQMLELQAEMSWKIWNK
jgi:shikimate dehydrogenase